MALFDWIRKEAKLENYICSYKIHTLARVVPRQILCAASFSMQKLMATLLGVVRKSLIWGSTQDQKGKVCLYVTPALAGLEIGRDGICGYYFCYQRCLIVFC